MNMLIVKENHVIVFGFTFSQYKYSSSDMRSLNPAKGRTPKFRIRLSLAGIVVFTWSFSVDLSMK
jgi:hypothetical protein